MEFLNYLFSKKRRKEGSLFYGKEWMVLQFHNDFFYSSVVLAAWPSVSNWTNQEVHIVITSRIPRYEYSSICLLTDDGLAAEAGLAIKNIFLVRVQKSI